VTAASLGASARTLLLVDIPSLLRLHIVGVALLAQVVFAWLFTGRYALVLVPFVAIDWFVINLVNRVTDLAEDVANGVPGADIAARRKRLLVIGSAALFFGSLAVSHLWVSRELTPVRIAVQVIGLFYNLRWIPWPGRWTRFKEMYFFKNTMSAMLFVLTCIVYPLAFAGYRPIVPIATIVAIAVFFVAFELSYEVLYDFRDLEGDRREGVPTYPVVHGPHIARRILDGLVLGSAIVLLAAFVTRTIGLRELLMVAAPVAQRAFYGPRLTRGLTHHDCIVVTNLGSALLVFYLAGTAAWSAAGLPENVFIGG
jgi:4-hydroxybenzoate polyprenyltransferase